MKGMRSCNTRHENRAASIDACRYPPFSERRIGKARTKVELSGPHLLTSKCSKKIRLALAIVSLGLLAPIRATLAQQADELTEVIVTATKRESIAQNTPMSITVIGPDVLSINQIDDFADFAFLVPGLTSTDTGPGNKRYALRGLQSPGEPEVALYYDEIPISGLPGASLDTGDDEPDVKLWDVDRIEVLRGPEGTLYGNGSMGGAIRIISKRPDLTAFDAKAEAQGAVMQDGGPSWGASGLVNVPIVTDQFAIRATFYDRYNGGWLDEDYRSNIALPQVPGNDLNWEHT